MKRGTRRAGLPTMLFNSFEFLVFLPIVFALYFRLSGRNQNILLILASYVFYGWWDWRFLSLIILSSAVDYVAGIRIAASSRAGARRLWLGASLVVNLGALAVFKYFNFFADSAVEVLQALGFDPGHLTLQVILPVGISFYTFQTLSYTIDVYRRKIPEHRSAVDFFAFVSFFPQLVAGPIERASNLLGQFEKRREFDFQAARDGCRQMLWGFFKKIVIADSLAPIVNAAYATPGACDGATLLLATLFFAVQIYCDFSGYSDIAIGCARLFGIRLMRNFAFPYFAAGIGDFWQRWHISLSTWFRDYVYIPLGGGRTRMPRRVMNVLTTFVVSGLWHGANWTFVVWGFLHGLYYVPSILLSAWVTWPRRLLRLAPLLRPARILFTFALVNIGWVFFRAASLGDASLILGRIASGGGDLAAVAGRHNFLLLLLLAFFLCEWLQRRRQHALEIGHLPGPVRWLIYYVLVGAILLWGNFQYVPFIYFQF